MKWIGRVAAVGVLLVDAAAMASVPSLRREPPRRDPFQPAPPARDAGDGGAPIDRLRLRGLFCMEGRTLALLEDDAGSGFVVESGAFLPTVSATVVAIEDRAVRVADRRTGVERRLFLEGEEVP